MTFSKRWKRVLVFAGIFLIGMPAVVLYLVLDSEPSLRPVTDLSHADVSRIRGLIKQNNPLYLRRNEVKTIALTEQDITLLINYGLSYGLKQQGRIWGSCSLRAQEADFRLTHQLPDKLFGKYLNVDARVNTENGKWRLEGVRVGSIRLPGWLSVPIAGVIHEWAASTFEEYQLVASAVQQVNFQPQVVSVVYQWRPEVIDNLRSFGRDWLIPEEERERIRVYYNYLALQTHRLGKKTPSALDILRPMFELARQRTGEGQNAVAENRALIMSLAFYFGEVDTRRILGAKKDAPMIHPRSLDIRLRGRHDLIQHFFVSAALTVSAGQQIADVFGLAKEMSDSMGGSGFSFADLLADRTGVRFAEIAIENEVKARQLHINMLNANVSELDIMPPWDELPEGLTEKEFEQNYKNTNSETYRRVEDEITRRISSLPFYSVDFSASL